MNQILLTEKQDNRKKRNRNNTNGLEKIIAFFGVAIIIFGLAIAALYSYKLYRNKNPKEQIAGKPEISLEVTETEIIIKAKSEIGLEKIIYTWNDEEPNEIAMSGRTSQEEAIDIPSGDNTLKVEAIDINGESSQAEEKFSRTSNEPNIEISVEGTRVKITAKDEIAMKYIKYRWNEEEEEIVNVKDQGDKSIEVATDVKRGINKLTVTAINSQDIEKTVEKTFKGENDPVIEVKAEGTKVYMTISHDMGFEKVEFYVNGKIYKYNSDYPGYDPTKKKLEYSFDLQEGENTVVILAVSTEGSQVIYRGKRNYPFQ